MIGDKFVRIADIGIVCSEGLLRVARHQVCGITTPSLMTDKLQMEPFSIREKTACV